MAKVVVEADLSRGYSVYFSRPGVAVVTWDPTLRAVYAEAQGWADSIELVEVLEACICALTEHRGSRWLVDGRKMKVIKQSDQDWIYKEFLPRALAAGLEHIALVTPESGLAKITVEALLARLPATKVDFEYFVTIGAAKAWIKRVAPEPPSLRRRI
jgi:stage II sporulation SpoAA-like protein